MKKSFIGKRILAVVFCLALMLGIFALSAFAAKEMFTTYQIDDVTITGIDAPVAGKQFDFTAEENSQKYNVIKVAWMSQNGHDYITSTSVSASAGKKYTVYVVLEVATPSHYFMTGEGRVSAVSSVTVNGNTAQANNTQDYSLFSIDASKYEHDTTYQKYLTVMYTFPETEAAPIESIEFGIPELVSGERVPTTWQASGISIDGINGGANNGQVNVNKVEWSLQDGTTLAGNEVFEYGKKYTLTLTLGTAYGASFATDPNHFLAQPGKPFPVVEVKMNGKTATVLPTYDSYSNMYVVAACVFDCNTVAKIKKIELTSIDAPETGKSPDYEATYTNANYGAASYNNATTKNGISWYNETDKKVISTTDRFEAGKTYTAQIMVWANDQYEFQYKSGAINVTATVNGNSADVSSRSEKEATLYYTFPKTEEHKHSAKKVDEIEASCKEEGKKAYYFCPECGKNFEDSKCLVEIADINAWGVISKTEHNGGKASCKEKAICKDCGETYGELGAHSYGSGWGYKDALGHAHTCKICGVPDSIQPHSGGNAVCGKYTKCEECKTEYGEIIQHKWSASWEYKSSKGHAHVCSECGEHDTVIKHTPGAEATQTTSQNCKDCDYVIAAAKDHEHKLTKVPEVKESCTKTGIKKHYVCEGCGELFNDSKGNEKIEDADDLIIPLAAHKESKWKFDEKTHWKECTAKDCDAIIDDTELEHSFGDDGKCEVCGYAQGKEIVESNTEEDTESDSEVEDTNVPAESNSGDDTGVSAEKESDSSLIWIIIAVAVVIVAVGVIAFTVLMLRKKSPKA